MEHYLILARSVTYAQRMQRAVSRAGIRCRMFRAPRDLSDSGCAYAIELEPADLANALYAVYGAALGPVRVFLYQNGSYREVSV